MLRYPTDILWKVVFIRQFIPSIHTSKFNYRCLRNFEPLNYHDLYFNPVAISGNVLALKQLFFNAGNASYEQ